jgi:plastocyanin
VVLVGLVLAALGGGWALRRVPRAPPVVMARAPEPEPLPAAAVASVSPEQPVAPAPQAAPVPPRGPSSPKRSASASPADAGALEVAAASPPVVEATAVEDAGTSPGADAGTSPRSCALEGTVTLLRNGQPVPPGHSTVVVYVSGVRRRSAGRIVTMLQEGRQFVPSVLVLHTGDTIRFENRDPVDHSVFSNSGANTFDLPRTTRGVTGMKSFSIPGAVRIQCDIHSTMRADVLVLENDYFGVADGAGAWRIEDLPEGRYTVTAWEPNGGTTRRDVSACDGPVTLRLSEQGAPDLRRKSGDRYQPEYDAQ